MILRAPLVLASAATCVLSFPQHQITRIAISRGVGRHSKRRRTTLHDSIGAASEDAAAAAATAPLADLVKLPECFKLDSPDGWEFPLEEGQRLICIGDIHGDCEALEECMAIAGVYEEADDEEGGVMKFGKWVGGNTIVVQTGDVLDRGNEELACFLFLAKMSREAKEAGGAVIVLHGNHEIFNTIGDPYIDLFGPDDHELILGPIIDRCLTTPKWRKQYGDKFPCQRAAYEPGGLLAEPIMSKLKVAVKVGKTVCVHGGLGAEMLDRHGGIDTMNQRMRKWTLGFKSGGTLYESKRIGHFSAFQNNLGDYSSRIEASTCARNRRRMIRDSRPSFVRKNPQRFSPMFDKRFSSARHQDEYAYQDLIDGLHQLQADRLVVGHTPQKTINSIQDGKVWRIDVAMSRFMHGESMLPEVLQVKNEGGVEIVSVLRVTGEVSV